MSPLHIKHKRPVVGREDSRPHPAVSPYPPCFHPAMQPVPALSAMPIPAVHVGQHTKYHLCNCVQQQKPRSNYAEIFTSVLGDSHIADRPAVGRKHVNISGAVCVWPMVPKRACRVAYLSFPICPSLIFRELLLLVLKS